MALQKIRKTVRSVVSQHVEPKLKTIPFIKDFFLMFEEKDKDKQLHSLRRAYIGAFFIIGILTLLSHVVTSHITSNEKENAQVTVMITKMQSMVENIVSQATLFKSSGSSFDDNLLTTAVDNLRTYHAQAAAYGDDAINELLTNQQYLIGKRIDSFTGIVADFLKYRRTNQSTDANIAFTALSGESSKGLQLNLDLALEQYRGDILSEISRASHLQTGGVVIIFVVLLLELFFIFNPLVKHLEEYHKYLIKLALTDMLTNLNNRRAFMQLANAGLDYYKRHKKPFVLVLMDLDHFKSVNDTYGHKVGDLVLQHYSALMQKTLRAHDTLGRIGGEEFSIFLPQISAEEATTLIERCRKAVAETPCPYTDGKGETKTLNYSSSFGAVAVTEGVWTLDELFIAADEQLYKAKEQGRNRVVMTKLSRPVPVVPTTAVPATPSA